MCIMDLIFLRLGLEQYKTSRNIFKRIYYYIKIWIIQHRIILNVIEDYKFYDLIIEYIELIHRMKAINPFISISNDAMIDINLAAKRLEITYRGDKIILIADDNKILRAEYIVNYKTLDEYKYCFEVEDMKYLNMQIEMNQVRDTVWSMTTIVIVKSIQKLMDEM